MTTPDNKQPPSKTAIGAGAAGASGGTLLIIIARGLPDNSSWKQWLLLAAPTVTVVSSALIAAVVYQCKTWIRDRLVSGAVAKAKRAIADCLDNPQTSDDHKQEMRKKLENIEKMEVDNKLENAKRLIESPEFLPNKSVQATK